MRKVKLNALVNSMNLFVYIQVSYFCIKVLFEISDLC